MPLVSALCARRKPEPSALTPLRRKPEPCAVAQEA
jgi:hypothetical protein